MTKEKFYIGFAITAIVWILFLGILGIWDRLDKLIDLCTFPETEETLEVEDEPVVDLYLEMEC